MPANWELIAIIAAVVIAACIAGLYFGGSTIKSTGGDMVNATNGSVVLGWAGVPVGSWLIDTGNSWMKTAQSITGMIAGLFIIGGAIALYMNKK
jgi:hypothetical protein